MNRKSLIVIISLLCSAMQMTAQEGSATFEFIENKGQWDKQVRFRGDFNTGSFFLQKNGFTVMQHNGDDLQKYFTRHHEVEDDPGKRPDRPIPTSTAARTSTSTSSTTPVTEAAAQMIRTHAYRVQFAGANENCEIVPEKQVPTHTNYFLGNDPSKWASDVSTYGAIVYKDIYPNIDIRYYSDYGRLKYDLIVRPGGDVSKIVMKYEGAEKLTIKKNELYIKTSVGDVKELYPYSYEFNMTTGKKEVKCSYELVDKNTVRFKIDNYTKTSTLVIDPSLVFCSFTGSPANQYGYTATPGPDGSLYSGGIVFGSGFPTTAGAYQVNFQGGSSVGGGAGIDIGIFKFTPSGQRSYATYLGGNANDYPHSLFCDPQGNLVIMGKTFSNNYPGTLVGLGGGSDIIVTKLNAAGSALIGSLRIGGTSNDGVNVNDQIQSGGVAQGGTFRFYGDDSRSEVILDGANNIYVAAQTQSTNFPVTAGAFQGAAGGGQDGAILKINPNCTSLTWASYLGGSGGDGAFVLAIHPTNSELYVAGATTSTNFPMGNSAGVLYPTSQGGNADGFVSRISNDGTRLISSSYMGTTSFDAIYGIQFDKYSFPYIMGVTEGAWPVQNAPYSVANSKQFVSKLKPDLSGFVYSTVFGNGSARPNISPVAFLVDRCENVYISGWGGWLTPTRDPYNMDGINSMPITPDAVKTTTDNRDFYFIVIKRDAASLLYGTYFGQSGGEGEHVDGGTSRYDAQGVIYQAICANCFQGQYYEITRRFPTTLGVWAQTNGSRDCNLAAVKLSFNFAGVAAGPRSYFNGRFDTIGCVPFTVQLRDTVLNAKSYEWDFDGDGVNDLTTTTTATDYTFNSVGIYKVRLIAVDSESCNERDTAYITIHVRNDPAVIDFTQVKDGPCTSLTFKFTNLSTSPAGKPFTNTSFSWDFNDNSPVQIRGVDEFQHTFPSPGTYNVSLTLLDTGYCNGGDIKTVRLGVVANVKAQFESPSFGCAPYRAVFTNTSLGGHDFFWDFGDGTTSTEISPVHDYNAVGTYTGYLIAVDSNTCNKRDSLPFTIPVHPRPTAAFSVTPQPPLVNKPITFLNQSIGAVKYTYYFDDGDSTTTNSLENVQHQYNATDTYLAKLVAYNEFGCTDTVEHPVQALIDPLLDVPNAFTPGRFGQNSTVKVTGFGIDRMTWRIYNRWGQKVFETNDRRIGWDGTYNGKLQPMDVYTYTLDVQFTDKKTLKKTGDITLIR